MKEQIFSTEDVSLNYFEGAASGNPLLFLHARSYRWQSFANLFPKLSDRWHIYAVDLRGHGKSSWVQGSYRIQDYVQDGYSFIKKCINKPAIIFGHSLGGMIGIMIAALYPDAVKALIIGDSPISLDVLQKSDGKRTRYLRELAQMKEVDNIVTSLKNTPVPVSGKERAITTSQALGENNPWFQFMAESLSQNDPDMLTAMIDRTDETFREYKFEELFSKIKCPVLILQGDSKQGGLIRNIDVEKALTLLPNAKHIVLSGVGHSLHMQDKDAVVDAIAPFLESL